MKKPIGYILEGQFQKKKSDFSQTIGEPEPMAVYSQTQIFELFEALRKKKEVPFRHTTIVDWDNIAEEFEKFGIK